MSLIVLMSLFFCKQNYKNYYSLFVKILLIGIIKNKFLSIFVKITMYSLTLGQKNILSHLKCAFFVKKKGRVCLFILPLEKLPIYFDLSLS